MLTVVVSSTAAAGRIIGSEAILSVRRGSVRFVVVSERLRSCRAAVRGASMYVCEKNGSVIDFSSVLSLSLNMSDRGGGLSFFDVRNYFNSSIFM